MSGTAPGTALDYQGAELTLFAHAVNWKRYFSRQLRPYLGESVVEVGAGLGGTTGLLYSGQSSWICLEPDPAMAADLSAAIGDGRLPRACRAEAGIVEDLLARGQEGRHDSVVYIDVLEHIEADRAELAAAWRLLKPGGHLVVL
jgi:2-polyprenyl-3-methyl-5-hydroxy-6-metoxy-1,4-benzoquinol methylase